MAEGAVPTGTSGGTALKAPAKIAEKFGWAAAARHQMEAVLQPQAANPRYLRAAATSSLRRSPRLTAG